MIIRKLNLLILLILFSGTALFAQSALEGQQAPEFNLKSIDGKQYKLSELTKDGPVLLDFWATWCVPCKQALPFLAKIHEENKAGGFQLVAISTDNTRSVGKVRPYVKSQGWDFKVLLDTDNEVLKRYRANSVPLTVLISKDGKIVKTWIGYHPGEEKEIDKFVKEMLQTGSEE